MAEQNRSYEVRVVGARTEHFRDLYHAALRVPFWALILRIVVMFLGLNVVFAAIYVETGGIANAHPGSVADAFFFSVQTMGTIGYGAMYPTTPLANTLVVMEAVIGLLVTAVATGLIFAKFSQPLGRIAFTRVAVISPVDNVPTLMMRLGNERGNTIMEAHVRVVVIRTGVTAEGVKLYRMADLPLLREHSPALTRSWTVMHAMGEGSPLHGATPESLARDEVEVIITVAGTDDTSLQPVHARRQYEAREIVWGARYADVLADLPDGNLVLDVRKFNDLEPTRPTETFPYPRASAS
jgi:inward rectifier potassium channel